MKVEGDNIVSISAGEVADVLEELYEKDMEDEICELILAAFPGILYALRKAEIDGIELEFFENDTRDIVEPQADGDGREINVD